MRRFLLFVLVGVACAGAQGRRAFDRTSRKDASPRVTALSGRVTDSGGVKVVRYGASDYRPGYVRPVITSYGHRETPAPEWPVRAEVRAVQRETSDVYSTRTNRHGRFEFSAIPPGVYDVEVRVLEPTRTRSTLWPEVVVEPGMRTSIDIVLDDPPLQRVDRSPQ